MRQFVAQNFRLDAIGADFLIDDATRSSQRLQSGTADEVGGGLTNRDQERFDRAFVCNTRPMRRHTSQHKVHRRTVVVGRRDPG